MVECMGCAFSGELELVRAQAVCVVQLQMCEHNSKFETRIEAPGLAAMLVTSRLVLLTESGAGKVRGCCWPLGAEAS